MQAMGKAVDIASIEADLAARDLRDATRSAAPLVAAQDAVVLDTSLFDREEAVSRAIALVMLRI
jgi:cytidylate kinase